MDTALPTGKGCVHSHREGQEQALDNAAQRLAQVRASA